MSVWVCCPSIRPVEHVRAWAAKWRERGYHVALWRDDKIPEADVTLNNGGKYPGYARAVNELVANVMELDPDAEWFILAGDDIYPDANYTAEEIAESCERHFSEEVLPHWKKHSMPSATFGVMQPTGDRWADRQGPMSERVAGSAWCGREFCKRVNRGTGPLWPEYFHYCVDEELQHVATRMGIFWQRPDIIHLHEHYMRSGDAIVNATVPAHLEAANRDFMNARRKFATRLANGFPGSECL